MTAFIITAATLAAASVAWMLAPLLRREKAAGISREASNLSILLDQLRELNADLADGSLSAEQHAKARHELEERALEETRPAGGHGRAGRASNAAAAAVIAIALPMASALLYLALGDPRALAVLPARVANPVPEHVASRQKADEMASALARRLDTAPNNLEGWVMLARTYAALNRLQESIAAFERAASLAPDNPEVLVDYADVLALSAGRNIQGKPLELIQRALKLEPSNWKALVLAGTEAFDRKDYSQASAYWEKARVSIPAEPVLIASIEASLAEARRLNSASAAGKPSQSVRRR